MPPATPKFATVLPPPRTPTKSGLRSSSPRLSLTCARGTNSNAVSNEKGAPVQMYPQQETSTNAGIFDSTNASSGTNASYRTNTLTSSSTTTPFLCTSLPSLSTLPPPSFSLRPPNSSLHPSHLHPPSSSQRPPSQYPPVLGMRRTHTFPLPLASQSSASGNWRVDRRGLSLLC